MKKKIHSIQYICSVYVNFYANLRWMCIKIPDLRWNDPHTRGWGYSTDICGVTRQREVVSKLCVMRALLWRADLDCKGSFGEGKSTLIPCGPPSRFGHTEQFYSFGTQDGILWRTHSGITIINPSHNLLHNLLHSNLVQFSPPPCLGFCNQNKIPSIHYFNSWSK